MGIYLGQAILYRNLPALAYIDNIVNNYNQSDANFDMEVSSWKENTKAVFGRKENTKRKQEVILVVLQQMRAVPEDKAKSQ